MRKITILISLLLFFLLVSFIPLSNVVKATADVVLSNWDDVASGLDSGTSGYFDFKNVGTANYFETSTDNDLSAPNSFKAYSINSLNNAGWWNLTSNFSYVGAINFSFYYIVTVNGYTDVMFKDGGGNNLITISFADVGAGAIVRWNDVSTGYHTILTGGTSTRYYLVITHNGTNQFNIKVENSAFAVVGNFDYAGSYASNWTTFETVYIYSHGGSGGGTTVVYFDNVKINTSPYSSSTKRTVNIRFIDDATGNSLGLCPDALNYLNLNGYIDSDLLDNPVNINSSSNNHFGLLSRFSFNNWVDGTIHSFDVTDAYAKKVVEDNLVTVYYDDYHLSMIFTGSTFIIRLRRIGTSATGNETTIGDDNGNNSVRFRFKDTLGTSSFFQNFGDYGALYDDYPYVYTLYGKCLWWSDYIDNGLSYNLSSSNSYIKFIYNFTNGSVYNFQFYDLWSYTPYGDYVHFDTIWTQPIMHDGDIYTLQLTVGYYENKTTGEITDTMPIPVKPPIIPKDATDFIEPYKLYIGIGLVVGMTLIPLIVGLTLASKTNISVMDIPGLVYVSFFLIGITVSCVLGFFDLWVIFFVLFALILVFAITWIQGRQTGG